MTLGEKIDKAKPAVVAIGFIPSDNKITIVGSGFFIGNEGKILTVAHLIYQIPQKFRDSLKAMVLVDKDKDGLERYSWMPISIVKEQRENDVVVFQVDNYDKSMHSKSSGLELGDSNKLELGKNAYFIGFPYAAQLINEGFGITLIVSKTIISNIKKDGVKPDHPCSFIILDAISNPGNSGCPLIDEETNKVIGIMSISFRMKSKVEEFKNLDIREPMHICGARPINLAKEII